MTKKELVRIIQEVVKIEVKKQVKQIFINENKSSLKSLAPKPKPVKKKVVKQKREFVSGNDALNDVLNETIGLSKGDEMEEYPTMGGGTFDSTRASELLGYGDSLAAGGDKQAQRNAAAAQTFREKGLTSNQVPEDVMNALTRDYSDLMKHDKFKSRK
jgi:hypothetical protein|tara:strand:+ start:759 stop:1232 length:474 start_codon:yes stop_codon:yes gene_type:complete